MRLKLLIKQGGEATEVAYLLETRRAHVFIGRMDCDVVVYDLRCSKRHAVLYRGRDGELRIRDLYSTNGTFLRGAQVRDHALRVGDEFRIGRTTIGVLECLAPNLSVRSQRGVAHNRE